MGYQKSLLQLHKEDTLATLDRVENIASQISNDDLKSLVIGIKGKIVFRWSPGYGTDKKDFNNAFPVDPLAIIYAVCYEDIRFCLKFAQENKHEFCVRSGGHSLAGYSVCSGLVIDLSNINNIMVDPNAKIAYVESGCTFEQIFPIIESYGMHMPSGECPTVAVAGFMMGGGYGFTSRTFGLGCDVVSSVTLMLSDGRIVMANANNNADLYWAVRGGTGGNFGVLLNITYRLVPLQEIYGVKIGWAFNESTYNAAQALAYIQNTFLVADILPNLGIELAIVKDTDGKQKVFFCATWIGSESELNSILKPMLAWPGAVLALKLKGRYFSINEQLLANTPDVPQDSMAFSRSTIIARALSSTDWASVLQFFLTAPNDYTTIGIECYGGAVNQVAKDSTAFIHRDALMDFFCDAIFTAESNDRHQNEIWSEAYYEFMKKFGNGHSYQNYPNRNQTDFKWAFWGQSYSRLLAIKQKYDPNNAFHFAQSIGPYLNSNTPEDSNYPDVQNAIIYEAY